MEDQGGARRPRLTRGDRLPAMVHPPPGPRSRELAAALAAHEAPGVNTLYRGEPSVVWAEALGANVLDVDGNRYVDLTAGFGVAAVGHRHPAVVEAVRSQAGRLLHGLADVAAHPARIELTRRLAALAPVATEPDAEPGSGGPSPLVHLAVSGSDAVEVALKTAVLATGRGTLLAFDPSYHGLTLGSLAATSRPAFRRPFAAHLHTRVRHLPWGCPTETVDATLAAAEADGEPMAAVIVEPFLGREGSKPPPAGWLPGLAAACRRHGALLVADEIFTGFGRTGALFAVDHEGVCPDLLVCGKALGGGLPLGAVVGRRELLEAWDGGGEALHTGTFLGNPPAMAAALAVLDLVAEPPRPLVERAARLGRRIEDVLGSWPERHPAVVDVRGRGLLWGIETDRPEVAAAVARRCLADGVMILAGGPTGTVLQVAPPLVIGEDQLENALARLDRALAEAGRGNGNGNGSKNPDRGG